MSDKRKQIATFRKNVNILSDAITNKQIDPKHFTASEVGLSGSACRSLKDHWGIIMVIDYVVSFIPVDKDKGIYRKIETNVYKICGSTNNATTIIRNAYKQAVINYYSRQVAALTAKINLLQRNKEVLIKKYLS